jgi:hypothetical protein
MSDFAANALVRFNPHTIHTGQGAAVPRARGKAHGDELVDAGLGAHSSWPQPRRSPIVDAADRSS